ncbi:hypothetical protein [Mariniflexile sp.]|uniref:hypothetical protein n=1 Tax=Mariniflexile sp. TaxID=1979402 RepID=UPI004047CE90
MRILKTALAVMGLCIMLPLTAQSQDQESFMLNLTEFTIKFGHDSNFQEGVKKWNKCYQENNGTDKWNVWHRVQGKGNVYVLSGRLANWAEMDKPDETSKMCRAIALDFIIPHIESTEFNTTRYMPEWSKKASMEGIKLVWVSSFKVKNSTIFDEVVKDVSAALIKKEGDNRGYWYRFMGGSPDQADYIVSTPFKSYADLDIDVDSVWKVYEAVQGKTKTTETRNKFRSSLDSSWSYLYTLEEELSNQ